MNSSEYNDWQESLLCLPNQTFFQLMRLYLGEIKTPFNKQRLIEQLSSFLSKHTTQKIIVQSLDSTDVLILTAVKILQPATRYALQQFFTSEYSIHSRLTNMEERLLIYRIRGDENSKTAVYKINPLLYNVFAPLLEEGLFFLPEEIGMPESSMTFIDDLILAGLYSFFLKRQSVLKKNGAFKSAIEKQLQQIFPDFATDTERIALVCTGLQGLGLLLKNDTYLYPQEERWAMFFKQQPFERKMYLAAGIFGHSRREILYRRATVFAHFLADLDPRGVYSDAVLHRFYYFVMQKSCCSVRDTLFSHSNQTNGDTEEFVIKTAKVLGFLLPTGSCWRVNTAVFSQEAAIQPLIIAPSFEMTIFPYTSFEHIFPVLHCLEPVLILTTGRFEITRAACGRCFESHRTDTALIDALQKASDSSLPQNIQASITEWYLQYTSVGLYHGFVISVVPEKRNIFKQNTVLQGIVYKELADGIYLLRQTDFEKIYTTIKSAGLDLTFYRVADTARYKTEPFAAIECLSCNGNAGCADYTVLHKQQKEREQAFLLYSRHLKNMVENLSLTQEDEQSLKERIAKKLILFEDMLCGISVKNKLKEVSGLDFLGKIRLAETAIAEQAFLKIYIDEHGNKRIIDGIPVSIEKKDGDAVVLMKVRKTEALEKVSIARSSKMIMVRHSLF